MTTENKRNFLINLAFAAVIGFGIYFILKFAAAYLFPFLIGVALAAITQKPAGLLSKKIKIKSGILAAIMVLLIFILSVAAVFFILSRFYSFFINSLSSLKDFLPSLGSALSDLTDKVSGFFDGMQMDLFSSDNGITLISGFLENTAAALTEAVSGFAAKTVSRLPSFIFALSVTVVASCYIAKDYEKIKSYVKSIIPSRFVNRYIEIRQAALNGVFRMGKGYFLMFLFTLAQLALGFLLLGRKNWLMLALAVSLVDILPVLGTGTVLLPWAVIELLFGRPSTAAGLIVLYLAVMVLRHILEPKIIGKQTGLHPLLCLGAMFVGLKSIGFWGLILFPFSLMVLLQLIKSGKIKI